MIGHLFRYIWNRKRSNLLILLEMVISYLILYAISCTAVYLYRNASFPLGFEYQDLWSVTMQFDRPYEPEMAHQIGEVVNGMRLLDVEGVGVNRMKPFADGGWQSSVYLDKKGTFTRMNAVNDDYANLVGIDLTEGRWFSHEDDSVAWIPVTVNRRLGSKLFGDESPLGKRFYSSRKLESRREYRVIGVFEDFRQYGELSRPGNYMFVRYPIGEANPIPMEQLVIKVRPGTDAAFEETLLTNLQRLAPHWSFTIEPWSHMRKTMLQKVLAPAMALGVLTCFMLLMVGLGLFGVLWQSVTRRRSEIGLRRAMGANTTNIAWQIILEMLVLTGLAVAVGVVFAAQVPLLDWFSVPNQTYVWGMVLAALFMALLSCVCAVYPGWLASRIQPAEALHYE